MLSFKAHGTVTKILEQKNKRSVVFCFGRFQPITTGHGKLINMVLREATSRNADSYVFPSHSQDNKKNPLAYADKIHFIGEMFPGVRLVDNAEIKDPFIALKMLSEAGYKSVTMICGSDRVSEYLRFSEIYNGHEDPEKRLGFNEINIVDVGEREGMISATELREHAKAGHYLQFKKGIPSYRNDLVNEIYNKVRIGLRKE